MVVEIEPKAYVLTCVPNPFIYLFIVFILRQNLTKFYYAGLRFGIFLFQPPRAVDNTHVLPHLAEVSVLISSLHDFDVCASLRAIILPYIVK